MMKSELKMEMVYTRASYMYTDSLYDMRSELAFDLASTSVLTENGHVLELSSLYLLFLSVSVCKLMKLNG